MGIVDILETGRNGVDCVRLADAHVLFYKGEDDSGKWGVDVVVNRRTTLKFIHICSN